MKLAVVGSRSITDYKIVEEFLDSVTSIDCLVSGGAKGADSLAERYGAERKIRIMIFYPDWKKYGKSAGFQRNLQIVDYCDSLVAFWDGRSNGTRHSIELARRQGKLLAIKRIEEKDE